MDNRPERHIGDILKERNIEIVGADLATRHGFTQVPNFILTNKDISVGAKLAYAMLLKYAWNNDACFPGQLKLAEDSRRGSRLCRSRRYELGSFNDPSRSYSAEVRFDLTGVAQGIELA